MDRIAANGIIGCSLNLFWFLYPQTSSPTAYLFINLGLPDLALTHGWKRFNPYVNTQQEDQESVAHLLTIAITEK
jgi:hypothetical protein